jgi:hypothetical protein
MKIQTSIASISGADGPSISVSLYSAFAYPYQSAIRGALTLSSDIGICHDSTDEYILTVTGAIGSFAIGPKATIYLNKCTYVNDMFIVGGSVFNRFDSGNIGPLLSSMSGLNSLTGQSSCLSSMW